MKIFTLLVILLFGSSVHAQLVNVDLWKLRKEWGFWQFERANTARFSFYMGRVQKRSILLMNLARQDGEKFTNLVSKPYFEKHPKWDEYYTEFESDNLPMLLPSFRLWLSAFVHAIPSGLFGYVGHQGFNARMNIFANVSSPAGENCSYGHFTAFNIVHQLISSPPHQANILNDEYSRVAVAKFIHVKESWNSVTTFGGPKFFDITFRNHNQLKHFQVNASLLTSFKYPILDLSIGMRHFNEVSAGRWSLGAEMILAKENVKYVPKVHWASEFYYTAIGANLLFTKDSNMKNNVIFRPEISFRFPYSIIRKRGRVKYEFLDLEKSNSSIGISYGYNIGLLNRTLSQYKPHMVSLTFTRNFGFFENQNR
jgi:hypothetical protein